LVNGLVEGFFRQKKGRGALGKIPFLLPRVDRTGDGRRPTGGGWGAGAPRRDGGREVRKKGEGAEGSLSPYSPRVEVRWPGHGGGQSSVTALVAVVLQSLGRGGGGRNGLVVVESRPGRLLETRRGGGGGEDAVAGRCSAHGQ